MMVASTSTTWLLLKRLHSNDAICAALQIFLRNLANFALQTYGTPSRRGLRLIKLITYTQYDGRNKLIEYSKIEKRCGYC